MEEKILASFDSRKGNLEDELREINHLVRTMERTDATRLLAIAATDTEKALMAVERAEKFYIDSFK